VRRVSSIDRLDADLLRALSQDPRMAVGELAAATGVTRNTVQARLARLLSSGVVEGFSARLDLARLGCDVVAFVHVELAQAALDGVVAALAAMPSVLEVTATTGRSDLIARVAVSDHAQLQAVLQEVLAVPGVERTTTEIALTTPVPYRVGPLLAALTQERGRGRSG
jgi:DNA-binding Lrp family transcriptional regulator